MNVISPDADVWRRSREPLSFEQMRAQVETVTSFPWVTSRGLFVCREAIRHNDVQSIFRCLDWLTDHGSPSVKIDGEVYAELQDAVRAHQQVNTATQENKG